MDTIDFSRFVFAFLFVIGLIGLMGFFLKRYGGAQAWLSKQQGEGRLTLVETRYLDAKHRLVLVRRDDTEHLLLLSDGRETVIESGITTGKNDA